MSVVMGDVAYASHVKEMHTTAGIKANASRRRHMEARYFLHHKALGVKLRGKYRMQ